jgi:hypothetical protein
VAQLKDNINTMIDNLRVTTERNKEQDWLKTNLAKFTRMLQGQRDLFTVGQMLLSELAPLVEAQQGSIYQMTQVEEEGGSSLRRLAGYANRPDQPVRISMGEGLVGQCAHGKERVLLTKVPLDYTPIRSSLGEVLPANIVVLPVLFEGQTKAVIELASMHPFTAAHLNFLEQLTESIGVVLNTIEATMRTEGLLQQSQQLTAELQAGQKELQQTNEELGQKAQELAEQNAEVERKNMEIEQARRALEEKSRGAGPHIEVQIRVPGEHVARVAHAAEFHPDLGQQLAENSVGNLNDRQVEFARQHFLRGFGFAELDQRHSRSLQDRIGHCLGRG